MPAPAVHHLGLFHPRLVRTEAENVPPEAWQASRPIVDGWLDALRRGSLDETKETGLHGEFLVKLFGEVLGYRTITNAREGGWELVAEKSMLGGKSADGALGFFRKGETHVVAPIELKGARHFLDHARGILTPVQQAWDYANRAPESRWIVVSNYRETRLYAKSRGMGAYERFLLEELATQEGFRRFRALLGRDALLPPQRGELAPLDRLLVASEEKEREITGELYSDYKRLRVALFDELRRTHSNIPGEELLGYAQTILDRVLFLAFAEDRGLLPTNTVLEAFRHKDPYHPRPVWENFLAVFRAVDGGNSSLHIPAYNGGLFREAPEIGQLQVSDALCEEFKKIAEYDFHEDVSVDVLGHIFEQSISDLDELRKATSTGSIPPEVLGADASSGRDKHVPASRKRGGAQSASKRHADGIFYTPPFVTAFLVRETIGKRFGELREVAFAGKKRNKKEQIEGWTAYQNALRKLRVVDPACGSGAFLVAAFDALAQEFEQVNRTLAELQGGSFSLFDLTKTVLNENLFGIDLNGESVEIARLSLWLKTAERGKKLTYLDRNIRRGNSVVSDPRVDPRAFDWGKGRTAQAFLEDAGTYAGEAEEIDARWREGFDVVLGNPPYVRQELLTAYKDHWRETFSVFDGTADLFVYFFQRSLQVLKPGGRMAFIVSNKWMKGGYAERLRELLAREVVIETIVDFGHAPIFPDADAFPCVIVLKKEPPAATHDVHVTKFPREELGKELIASYVDQHRFPLPQASLERSGWPLDPPAVAALMEKLRRVGTPLAEYANAKPYYGIKTGCNEAFLVDQATRDRMVREDPRSSEILKKYLRGQDVTRWAPAWDGLWMLVVSSSENHPWAWSASPTERDAEKVFASEFPAIYAHLKPLEDRLRKRSDQGRYWWELRSCAYFDLFEKPKLVYQVIQFHPSYAVDTSEAYTNDKCFFLPTGDSWLAACLNSPAMWWYNWRYLVHMKDEALNPAAEKMMSCPIAPLREIGGQVAADVQRSTLLTAANHEQLAGLSDLLRVQYEVEKIGNTLSDPGKLTQDLFLNEIVKRRPKKSPLSPAGLKQLRGLYATEVEPMQARLAELAKLERAIAAEVHKAYGLTTADEQLLWETAPPRMPVGR